MIVIIIIYPYIVYTHPPYTSSDRGVSIIINEGKTSIRETYRKIMIEIMSQSS